MSTPNSRSENGTFRFVSLTAIICGVAAVTSVGGALYASHMTRDFVMVPSVLSGQMVSKIPYLLTPVAPTVFFAVALGFNLLFWETVCSLSERSAPVAERLYPGTRHIDQAGLMQAVAAMLAALGVLFTVQTIWQAYVVVMMP